MRLIGLLAALALTAIASGCASTNAQLTAAQSEGWSHYGEAIEPKSPTVSIGSLGGTEKNVVITGTIREVCAQKGCWMYVTDDTGAEVYVRFKDYAFFVPRNAAGHRAVLHGSTEKRIAGVDELRHQAEDAGKSEEEIARITQPKMIILFHADSVYIHGEGLDAPHRQ